MATKNIGFEVLSLREYCRGILADRAVNHSEATALKARMEATPGLEKVPMLQAIWDALYAALSDQKISEDESDELVTLLGEFCDSDTESLTASASKKPASDGAPAFLSKLVAGQEYTMVYTGSDGKAAERTVLLKQLREKEGVHYMACFCLKANGLRTFRADRVGRLVHEATGEILQ